MSARGVHKNVSARLRSPIRSNLQYAPKKFIVKFIFKNQFLENRGQEPIIGVRTQLSGLGTKYRGQEPIIGVENQLSGLGTKYRGQEPIIGVRNQLSGLGTNNRGQEPIIGVRNQLSGLGTNYRGQEPIIGVRNQLRLFQNPNLASLDMVSHLLLLISYCRGYRRPTRPIDPLYCTYSRCTDRHSLLWYCCILSMYCVCIVGAPLNQTNYGLINQLSLISSCENN